MEIPPPFNTVHANICGMDRVDSRAWLPIAAALNSPRRLNFP